MIPWRSQVLRPNKDPSNIIITEIILHKEFTESKKKDTCKHTKVEQRYILFSDLFVS